jgi:hypothetical protein
MSEHDAEGPSWADVSQEARDGLLEARARVTGVTNGRVVCEPVMPARYLDDVTGADVTHVLRPVRGCSRWFGADGLGVFAVLSAPGVVDEDGTREMRRAFAGVGVTAESAHRVARWMRAKWPAEADGESGA